MLDDAKKAKKQISSTVTLPVIENTENSPEP